MNADHGTLPAFKIGRAWFFWRADIEAAIVAGGRLRRDSSTKTRHDALVRRFVHQEEW
jgi:hypothetical protein